MRRKCDYPNCNRFGRNKGYYKGKTRYDHFCEVHHRIRESYYEKKQHIDNSHCELCGWNKAPCDRHRIHPQKGYVRSNIKVLCPNCHRLVSLGLLTISK